MKNKKRFTLLGVQFSKGKLNRKQPEGKQWRERVCDNDNVVMVKINGTTANRDPY